MNTDRDAFDKNVMGQAVADWLVNKTPEADVELKRVLLEQGVLSPADSFYIEHQSREHEVAQIHVVESNNFPAFWIQVSQNGDVELF